MFVFVFWARKLMEKEGIEENISTFYSLNLGIFASMKKTVFKIVFQKQNSRLSFFFLYTRPKKFLKITPDIMKRNCELLKERSLKEVLDIVVSVCSFPD